MPDILIRGLSEDALSRIDREAAALGLSRNEYLKRRLDGGHPAPAVQRVRFEDLERASNTTRDLLDPEIMGQAWR